MRRCHIRSWVPALEGPYCIQELVTTLWNTAHQCVRKVRDWNVWTLKIHIQDFASSAVTNSSTKAFGTGVCIVKSKAFNIMESTHPFSTSFILSAWRELLAFVLLITFSHQSHCQCNNLNLFRTYFTYGQILISSARQTVCQLPSCLI